MIVWVSHRDVRPGDPGSFLFLSFLGGGGEVTVTPCSDVTPFSTPPPHTHLLVLLLLVYLYSDQLLKTSSIQSQSFTINYTNWIVVVIVHNGMLCCDCLCVVVVFRVVVLVWWVAWCVCFDCVLGWCVCSCYVLLLCIVIITSRCRVKEVFWVMC